MKTMFLAAAATVAAMSPKAASAAEILYTLTGPSGGYGATWQLSSTPSPSQSVVGQGFALERVIGDFPGVTMGDAYIDFFSASNDGGLSISDADGPDQLIVLSGEQLYAGLETAPKMRFGMFALTDVRGVGGYTLTVSSIAAVPESATWALMLVGFGMIGTALRTRRSTVRYA